MTASQAVAVLLIIIGVVSISIALFFYIETNREIRRFRAEREQERGSDR